MRRRRKAIGTSRYVFRSLAKTRGEELQKSAGLQIIRKYDMQPGFFAEIDRKRRLENVTAPLFENFLQGKFSNKKEKHAFLHHRLSVGASPGGEKKPRNAALIFRFFRGGKLRDYYRYKYQRAAAKFYGGKRFL